MNKILYEASYIGSPKSFVGQITTGLELATIFIFIIYWLKEKISVKEDHSGYVVGSFVHKFKCVFLSISAFIFGTLFCLDLVGTISAYRTVILGYKNGEYQEVEGIVENYTEGQNQAFTIKGVKFQISEFVET